MVLVVERGAFLTERRNGEIKIERIVTARRWAAMRYIKSYRVSRSTQATVGKATASLFHHNRCASATRQNSWPSQTQQVYASCDSRCYEQWSFGEGSLERLKEAARLFEVLIRSRVATSSAFLEIDAIGVQMFVSAIKVI
jgi:hypothetical protein